MRRRSHIQIARATRKRVVTYPDLTNEAISTYVARLFNYHALILVHCLPKSVRSAGCVADDTTQSHLQILM